MGRQERGRLGHMLHCLSRLGPSSATYIHISSVILTLSHPLESETNVSLKYSYPLPIHSSTEHFCSGQKPTTGVCLAFKHARTCTMRSSTGRAAVGSFRHGDWLHPRSWERTEPSGQLIGSLQNTATSFKSVTVVTDCLTSLPISVLAHVYYVYCTYLT